MNRFKYLITALCLLCLWNIQSQNKYEREYRIKKNQFPTNALTFIEDQLKDARQIRYYRETDSAKISYEAKFKLDRLRYSVEFDEQGQLEDVEILIKEIDIPNSSMAEITQFLDSEFTKYRIRRLQQQYPVSEHESIEQTLKNAFQNLLIPSIRYELIIAGKKTRGFEDFEILFNAEGKFLEMRKSLPANYDHILY